MRLLLVFARAYPRHSLIMLLCLLLAAVAEGIGMSTLLPLLSLVAGESDAAGGGADENGLARTVRESLSAAGLEPTLGTMLWVIVAASVLMAALMLLAKRQVGYTVAHVATDLRLSLLRNLMAARWDYYTRQPVGALAASFSTQAERASASYLFATTIVSQVIQVILYAGIAFAVSWRATAAAMVAGSLTAVVLSGLVRMSRRAGDKQTRLLVALLRRLTDSLHAVKPLKAMARESLMTPMMEDSTERLNRALQRRVLSKEALKALQNPLLISFLAGGLYVAVNILGMALSSVIVLALLFARTLGSVNKAQRQYQYMVTDESAYWALRSEIDKAANHVEIGTGTRRPSLEREIRFADVDLSYGGRRILRSASLTIPAGEITALIGLSGSGKTSLADIAIGLVQPDSGRVEIDGVPLDEIDVRHWRSMVGYVPQEMFLVHDTISSNVTLGDPELGPADVETALRRAGAWEFVQALPQGVDTPVGERGALLSGGQRQRVAIARALIRRPQLLILDEATAALDPATESAVWDTMVKLRGDTTILAISHQPSLASVADRIYRVEGTGVERVESGETDRSDHREQVVA